MPSAVDVGREGRGSRKEGGEEREAGRKREEGMREEGMRESGRVGRGEGRGKEEGQVGNKKISTINGTNYILSMIERTQYGMPEQCGIN